MRRPGSAVVIKICSVLSFTHSTTAKNARSLATRSFSQSSSPLCTWMLCYGYSEYSLCRQGSVRRVQTRELKEGEGREDGCCLKGCDGSGPRLIGGLSANSCHFKLNDVLIDDKFPPCGC